MIEPDREPRMSESALPDVRRSGSALIHVQSFDGMAFPKLPLSVTSRAGYQPRWLPADRAASWGLNLHGGIKRDRGTGTLPPRLRLVS